MPKQEVKRTVQKQGKVVTVDEFLSLDRPKGDLIIKAGREQVAVTSLDRIYWPDEKLTKFDLLSYYLKVADYIMPYLQDRGPVLQVRHDVIGDFQVVTQQVEFRELLVGPVDAVKARNRHLLAAHLDDQVTPGPVQT